MRPERPPSSVADQTLAQGRSQIPSSASISSSRASSASSSGTRILIWMALMETLEDAHVAVCDLERDAGATE
jgi:hypothetical protein